MKKAASILGTCFLVAALMTGCGAPVKEAERGKDWDYTVVPTRDVPTDFQAEIDKKKMNAFQMTYENGEYLYMAVGYGEQVSGGFNIQVHGLYEKGEELCLETSLLGPGEEEIVNGKASYPYIVVKTQCASKNVNFET